MSAIRSALDEMSAVDDTELSDDELFADIEELNHVSQMIDVIRARRLKEISDRGAHVDRGYASPTAYLTHTGRMSAGHAKGIVSLAKAPEVAPIAHRAWVDGRLSTDQAAALFRLAHGVPDEYPKVEDTLVEIVESLSVRDTVRATEYWRQAVDGPGVISLESQMARRGLSLSDPVGGMRYAAGWLTQLAAEAFETALSTHMSPPSREDDRTPGQRRHDALEEMARCHLDHENTTTTGGEKPNVTVVTDMNGLKGIAGGRHETIDGAVLDVEAIRLLACDSSICRVVFAPNSEVVDIGRKTRVWTAAQRRAIIARDRHCTAEGCERPAKWCDIHHLDHWAHGGETNVDKGKLFCLFHHMLEHIKEAKRRRAQG